jgi:hypothetical protein
VKAEEEEEKKINQRWEYQPQNESKQHYPTHKSST